jgi:hypothetical protein
MYNIYTSYIRQYLRKEHYDFVLLISRETENKHRFSFNSILPTVELEAVLIIYGIYEVCFFLPSTKTEAEDIHVYGA